MALSNNVLAVLVIAAIATSVAGTVMMMSVLPGRPVVMTGMAQQTATGTALVELESVASIELVVNIVDFGTIESTPDTMNDTTDFSPHPFVVKNNGTVVINISIAEDSADALWVADDTNEDYFQFNSTKNTSDSSAISWYDWTDFSLSNHAENASAADIVTNPANLVYNLSATAEPQEERYATVHLKITVPDGEPGGQKSSNIFFLAAAG